MVKGEILRPRQAPNLCKKMSSVSLRFRLFSKFLWWKHYHPFNWAHKPLCKRFHRETFHVQGIHLCRSCTLLYAGLLLFTSLAIFQNPLIHQTPWIFLILPSLFLVIASFPQWYPRWNRLTRDLLRFGVGFVPPWLILQVCKTNPWVALVALGGLYAFWKYYFRLRENRKRNLCHGCPELGTGKVCSGYQRQAAAIRAYQIEASDYLTLHPSWLTTGIKTSTAKHAKGGSLT